MWSMATLAPHPIACIERWRLVREFEQAVSEYNRMNSAQVAAILADEDFLLCRTDREGRSA